MGKLACIPLGIIDIRVHCTDRHAQVVRRAERAGEQDRMRREGWLRYPLHRGSPSTMLLTLTFQPPPF